MIDLIRHVINILPGHFLIGMPQVIPDSLDGNPAVIKVGCHAMPEPSEIDLLQDKVKNPFQLIEEYKRENGIQTDPSLADMLKEIFEKIDPVINRLAGGVEYQEELVEVIKEFCDVKPSEIHINDVYKITNEYQEIISGI